MDMESGYKMWIWRVDIKSDMESGYKNSMESGYKKSIWRVDIKSGYGEWI